MPPKRFCRKENINSSNTVHPSVCTTNDSEDVTDCKADSTKSTSFTSEIVEKARENPDESDFGFTQASGTEKPLAVTDQSIKGTAKESKNPDSEGSGLKNEGQKSPEPDDSDSKGKCSKVSEPQCDSKTEGSNTLEDSDSKSGSSNSEESDSKSEDSNSSDDSDSNSESSNSSEDSESKSESSNSTEDSESKSESSNSSEDSDSKSEGSNSSKGLVSKNEGSNSSEDSDSKFKDSDSPEPEDSELKSQVSKSSEKEGTESEDLQNSEDDTHAIVGPFDPDALIDPQDLERHPNAVELADRVSRLLIQGRADRRISYRRAWNRGCGRASDDDGEDVELSDDDSSRSPSPIPPDPFFMRLRDGTVPEDDLADFVVELDSDVERGAERVDNVLVPYQEGILHHIQIPVAAPGNQGVLVPYVHINRRIIFVHLESITLRHYAFVCINVKLCIKYTKVYLLTKLYAGLTVDGPFRVTYNRCMKAYFKLRDRRDPLLDYVSMGRAMINLKRAFKACADEITANWLTLGCVVNHTKWIKDMYSEYVFKNKVIEADNTFPERFEELFMYVDRAQARMDNYPVLKVAFERFRDELPLVLLEEL